MEKRALIIGSAVADVTIRVDTLPGEEADSNAISQQMSLGGCACNVANMFRLMQIPYDLAAPVGSGIYGDFVRNELKKRNINPLFETDEEDGCCYCFVDMSGKRTFLSVHGAEYRFHPGWLAALDAEKYELGYCCGLEIEEETGEEIIRFFEKHPELKFCYAPGGRIMNIDQQKHDRLLNLHPILHLNLREAREYLGTDLSMEACSGRLFDRTGEIVVITDGANGASVRTKDGYTYVRAEYVQHPVNTTGAGDAHAGTFLGCILRGDDPADALAYANRIGAEVCKTEGAVLRYLKKE